MRKIERAKMTVRQISVGFFEIQVNFGGITLGIKTERNGDPPCSVPSAPRIPALFRMFISVIQRVYVLTSLFAFWFRFK